MSPAEALRGDAALRGRVTSKPRICEERGPPEARACQVAPTDQTPVGASEPGYSRPVCENKYSAPAPTIRWSKIRTSTSRSASASRLVMSSSAWLGSARRRRTGDCERGRRGALNYPAPRCKSHILSEIIDRDLLKWEAANSAM